MNDPSYTKICFIEFVSHFNSLDDNQVVRDIRKSIEDVERMNPSGTSFGSKMVREAMERRKSPAAVASRENGKKGGRPPVTIGLPRNKDEVIDFAVQNGLDVDDALKWAQINLKERKGRDKDGKLIRNWKGACYNYCKAKELKRREQA